ncbi:MAG: hypothetical protein HYS06_02335 [Methylocystis sp.]|nr:hypothetical protein [Methylocystis sp.]
MVRALNALQSQMALGDISARDATSKQIERIEQTLPAVAPEAWKDPKNARAAAIYLLSGGSSGAVHNLLEAHAFSKDDEALISGSLAYAEGHSRDAAKLLQPIDPKTVSPILGGHLALVGGGLLIGADNPRALDLLDLARLLMPGSLVEEAALRRQISVIDGAHDPEKLLLLGRRYVARYRHSPFAPNFWDEFAASIARIALDIDEPLLVKFEELFREMNASAKFEVYLTIAQRAILNGRIALATDQTNRAEPFAESPAARNRLKLYNALVWAISGNFEDGLAGLELIDSKSLARADAELREIVTAAVKQLQESPDADAPKPAPISALPKQEAEATVAARSPIESSAQQAIADADAMLRKASEQ